MQKGRWLLQTQEQGWDAEGMLFLAVCTWPQSIPPSLCKLKPWAVGLVLEEREMQEN